MPYRPDSPDSPEATTHFDLTERIERRAYDLYLERQEAGREGTTLGDWLQAEEELSQEQQRGRLADMEPGTPAERGDASSRRGTGPAEPSRREPQGGQPRKRR